MINTVLGKINDENGQKSKELMPGEFFASDPIECIYEKDEYLCLEITFSG